MAKKSATKKQAAIPTKPRRAPSPTKKEIPARREVDRRRSPDESYDAKRNTERDRQANNSRKGRDIGPPPPVENPQRRAEAEDSFRVFCETYFPERFTLAFSRDHLKIIERIEKSTNEGGLCAFAMPRGSGKTSICEVAVIWALVTGARKFVLLIGASADAAAENLDSIKTEFEANELLAADFPEVCYPIAALEGRANLCAGQHSNGQRTHITYGKKVLVLPTIDGSQASGGILRVAGITGRIRGMKFTRSDGKSVRPDLVVVDDPQTDASAKSEHMCAQREKLLGGAVLGLAGPGCQIAGFMPCTVIRRGDMADNVLDRKLHPAWHGERTKLVYAFPKNDKLWEEYAEHRAASFRNGGNGEEATDFYRKHRKAMDEGADVAWPERFRPGELSGLQYAMNLRIDNEGAFQAEYQNEPVSDTPEDTELLGVQAITAKKNGLARGLVPLACSRLTFFIDVQHRLLYWAAVAWDDNFGGAALDYGTWPEQPRTHFTYRTVRKTLQSMYPGDTNAAVRAGLTDLTKALFERKWKNESGAELTLERGLIDAADGNVTDAVFEFCRGSEFRTMLLPAVGKGIDATSVPMHQYKVKEGERLGFHWLLQPVPKRAFRQLFIDTNFWKSFLHERLAMPTGQKGAFTLFGDKKVDHRLLAEHLTSEYRERARNERSGRVVDVWKHKPAKPDNHWLDCFCGAAVAASYAGVSVLGKSTNPKPRTRVQVKF